ncbi:MAG: AAA family ATPase, partial [Flavobacteriaceae bacterium]|nr:AAA family ATPase [Flavobacteriaceae bacterium]
AYCTCKTSILELLKNGWCYVVLELEGEESIIERVRDLRGMKFVYYTPFLTQNDNYFDGGNVYNISKYSTIEKDASNSEVGFASIMEIHNSRNITRLIKFMEFNKENNLLGSDLLPIFENIEIGLSYIGMEHHNTSEDFRVFFDALTELGRIEQSISEQVLLDTHGLKDIDEIRNSTVTYKVKLEHRIIQGVIEKVHNILERSGNKYLKEGHILHGLTIHNEFTDITSHKEAFYWFLDNIFFSIADVEFPIDEIKALTEVLLSKVPEYDEIENWSRFSVKLSDALEIIETYEEFLLAFRKSFAYSDKSLLTFKPNINLSSGEKAMYDLFSSLHDLSYNIVNGVLDRRKIEEEKIFSDLVILLDEADLGFHPLWKRKFVRYILEVVPKIFSEYKIQVLFTTHDPLTLSDIPKDNIIFLNKNEQGYTFVDNRTKKTFGANVHDLLADSFFLEGGFMGDFAKESITDLINYLTYDVEKAQDENNVKQKKEYWSELNAEKVIRMVDEPLIKERLYSLYYKKFLNNDKIALEQRITSLQNQLMRMEDEEN